MKKVRYKGKVYAHDEAKGTLTELDASGNATTNVLTEFDKAELEPAEGGGGGGGANEAALNALRSELGRAKAELQKLQGSLGGLKPDEISSLVTELQERRAKEEEHRQEQLKKEGKLQQLLDEYKQKAETEKAQMAKEREEARAELRNFRIQTELMRHAARPDAVNADQVSSLIRPYVSVGEDGNLLVLDDDGKSVRLGKDAKPLTGPAGVKEFVDDFYARNPWFVRGHSGGAGSGGGAGGGAGSGAIRSKKDFKNDDERAAFIQEHGRDKYLGLPNG